MKNVFLYLSDSKMRFFPWKKKFNSILCEVNCDCVVLHKIQKLCKENPSMNIG